MLGASGGDLAVVCYDDRQHLVKPAEWFLWLQSGDWWVGTGTESEQAKHLFLAGRLEAE